MYSVRRQRLSGAYERWIDPHSARIAPQHGDHRRIRETARYLRRAQEAAPLALNDRHPVKSNFAAWRRDATNCAHQRVYASRQALPNERTGVAARIEPPDNSCYVQASQNVAEDHRGDDIAASRVEKNDAPQPSVGAPRFEEIDEGLRRFGLDDTVGHDDIRTILAAFAGFERSDTETHRSTALLRNSWSENDRAKHQRGQRPPGPKAPEAGGR